MVALIAIVGLAFAVLWFIFTPLVIWFVTRASGVNISLMNLIRMKCRKVPPEIIAMALVAEHKSDMKIGAGKWESHYIKGGNVTNTVTALAAAKKANIELDFTTAAALDLTGYDLLKLVKQAMESGSRRLIIPVEK